MTQTKHITYIKSINFAAAALDMVKFADLLSDAKQGFLLKRMALACAAVSRQIGAVSAKGQTAVDANDLKDAANFIDAPMAEIGILPAKFRPLITPLMLAYATLKRMSLESGESGADLNYAYWQAREMSAFYFWRHKSAVKKSAGELMLAANTGAMAFAKAACAPDRAASEAALDKAYLQMAKVYPALHDADKEWFDGLAGTITLLTSRGQDKAS